MTAIARALLAPIPMQTDLKILAQEGYIVTSKDNVMTLVHRGGSRHQIDTDFLNLISSLQEHKIDPTIDRLDLVFPSTERPGSLELWESIPASMLSDHCPAGQVNRRVADFYAEAGEGNPIATFDADTGFPVQGSLSFAEALGGAFEQWMHSSSYEFCIPDELEKYLLALREKGHLDEYAYRTKNLRGEEVLLKLRVCLGWLGPRRVRFVELLSPPVVLRQTLPRRAIAETPARISGRTAGG